MRGALVLTLLGVMLLGLVAGLHRRALPWPDRWNPFAPYVLDQTPNGLTRFKLHRTLRDEHRCQSVLATSGFTYRRLPNRQTGAGCGLRNAVLIHRTGVAIGAPISLSCRAALALAAGERHGLQPAARAAFGQSVVAIEHFGSYACRDVGGRTGRRSGHATADALDVAGLVLEDGRRLRVVQLPRTGALTEEARFLDAVRRAACDAFPTVLGPSYNAAHRDHFHLEVGGATVCR